MIFIHRIFINIRHRFGHQSGLDEGTGLTSTKFMCVNRLQCHAFFSQNKLKHQHIVCNKNESVCDKPEMLQVGVGGTRMYKNVIMENIEYRIGSLLVLNGVSYTKCIALAIGPILG